MTHTHLDPLEPRSLFAASGATDVTYAASGSATLTYANVNKQADITPRAVVADSAGRDYVVVGVSYLDVVDSTKQEYKSVAYRLIRRLNADGSVDATWAGSGQMKYDATDTAPTTRSEAVDASDRLLVLDGTTLRRFTTTGTPDASFGKKGAVTLPDGVTGVDLTFDAAGRIYVTGSRTSGSGTSKTSRATLTRLTAAGKVDASFAGGGTYGSPTHAPEGTRPLSATGVQARVFADGTVDLLADAAYHSADNVYGYTGAESIRLNAAGAVIAGYGTHGVASAYEAAGDTRDDSADAVVIRPDGSVVVNRGFQSDAPEDDFHEDDLVISADGKRQKTVRFAYGVLGSGLGFIDEAHGSTLVFGSGLTRIKADGTTDTSFQGRASAAAALQADGTVVTIAPQGSGNPTDRRQLTVTRIFLDDSPVTRLSAKRLTVGGHSASFSANYRDADGVNAATITGQELRVVAPDGGTVRPRLVSKTTQADGSITAVYKFLTADGGVFHADDDGSYAVRILADRVKDAHGVAIGKRTVGAFTVAI